MKKAKPEIIFAWKSLYSEIIEQFALNQFFWNILKTLHKIKPKV